MLNLAIQNSMSMIHKILLVEDEANLAQAILLNLNLEGYDTTWIKNGSTAYSALLERPLFYDLIILDVMLPEKDGLTICKNLRSRQINIPILFLSSKNSSEDKVLGLKAGGDDYLGKPFNLEELLLRVRILLKRPSLSKEKSTLSELSTFNIGNGKVFFDSFSIIDKNQNELQISKKEMALLKLLIQNKNNAVKREDILELVWHNTNTNSRSIDNVILNLRKYFEEDPKNPNHFFSIRGVGYKFVS